MLSLMLCGFCAVALVAGDSSTVRVSAQASASSSEGVEVSTGTFVVEQGARLAVEIVRSDPCVCLCDPIYITDLRLLNMASEAVHQEAYEAVEMADWVGRVSLFDARGGAPLPEGRYTVRVGTNVGSFSAQIDVVLPSALADPRRASATASVCGLELQLYRLIGQEDQDAELSLRVGDRMMVVLEGNLTTGYRWERGVHPEDTVLQETDEVEYVVRPHPEGMVGVGGEFRFRYEAKDVGSQAFRFVHHQPWNPDDPAAVLEFDVTVY